MSTHFLKNKKYKEQYPTSLLRSLVIIGAISLVIVMVASTSGFYTVYSRHIVATAEHDAVQLSNALLDEHKDLMLAVDKDGMSSLSIDNRSIPHLDSHLRKFLRPFSILKIKIYSDGKKIIYSTDRKIIGKIDLHNKRLARALAGQNDSLLEKKEQVLDLADEQRFDVDVVETYVPIRDKSSKVIGSFEIYVDVTKYRSELLQVVVTSSVILLLVLLFVYACALFIIRKMTEQLKRAHDELENMAITDELTGIFNRRHILSRSNLKIHPCATDKELPGTIGVLIIDIDHFKEVNDNYGHLAGDEVLKENSSRRLVKESCRSYDLAGRLGGEEFTLILPDTAMPEIIAIAKRVHSSIGEKPFLVDGHSLTVTICIGVSCTWQHEEDFLPAPKRADINSTGRRTMAGTGFR